MLETGFLAGLMAKLAGLGSAAKAAIAAVTAALTMTAAGAAAGVLPFPGSDPGSAGSPSTILEPPASVVPSVPAPSGDAGVQGGSDVSVTTAGGSTAAAADAGGSADAPEVPLPTLPGPAPGIPDLSGLAEIPTQVLHCLSPVLGLATGAPTVPWDQISQLAPTIVGCVSGIVENLPLPAGLDACVSEIMAFVSQMTSRLPTGMPGFGGFGGSGFTGLGGFNLAACIPSGLPVPSGFPGMGSGFPFGMGGGFPFGQY